MKEKIKIMLAAIISLVCFIPGIVQASTVAKINSTNYESLQDAIDGSGMTSTIVLQSDITLTEGITIPKEKNITIDLNSKKVNYVPSYSAEVTITTTVNLITNAGTLTIKDTGTGGEINLKTNGFGKLSLVGIKNNGTFILESGTLNVNGLNNGSYGNIIGVDNLSHSTVNITGGNVYVSRATSTNGGSLYGIKNGTTAPISNVNAGKIIVTNNSSLVGYSSSAYIIHGSSGLINITGGLLQATGSSVVYGVFGILNITGGTINVLSTADVETISTARLLYGNSNLQSKVTGGKFSLETAADTATSTIFGVEIAGGEFNINPTGFLKPYSSKLLSNGTNTYSYGNGGTYTYVVTTDSAATKNVKNTTTNTEYANLQEAINAASVGQTLKLLNDYNNQIFTTKINKVITLDLNGYDIIGTNVSEGILEVSAGTKENPVVITDNQATSYDNAGSIGTGLAISVINGGYAKISKIVIETNGESAYPINVKGNSTANSGALIKGVKIRAGLNSKTLEGTDTKAKSAIYQNTFSDVVVENLNTTFKNDFVVNTNASTITSIFHIVGGETSLVIEDGNFEVKATKSASKAYFINTNSAISNTNIEVNGGYYKISGTTSGISRLNANIFIADSYWNIEPDKYFADGYSPVADTTVAGYSYKMNYSPAASIGTTEYKTIQNAIDAKVANPSLGEIKLLRDVIYTKTLVLNGNISLNLNGHTLTLTANMPLKVKKNVVIPSAISVTDYKIIATDGNYTYYFKDFASAINESPAGSTIKLLDNVSVTSSYSFSKNLTIDLNGYNYTTTKDNAFSFVGPLLASEKTINISFVNTNTSDTESIMYGGIYIQSQAYKYNLTIGKNVEIKDNSPIAIFGNKKAGCITVNVYGKLTLETTGTEEKYALIQGNGTEEYAGTIVNIYDGATLTTTGIGIYNPQNGEVNIYGGTITGYTAIYMRSGKLLIDGNATIIGNGASFDYVSNSISITGDAIVIDNVDYPGGNPTIVIKSAKLISSTNGQAIAVFNDDDYIINVNGEVTINSNGALTENGIINNNGKIIVDKSITSNTTLTGSGLIVLKANKEIKLTTIENNKIMGISDDGFIVAENNKTYVSDANGKLIVDTSDSIYLVVKPPVNSTENLTEEEEEVLNEIINNVSNLEVSSSLVEAAKSAGVEATDEGTKIFVEVAIEDVKVEDGKLTLVYEAKPYSQVNGEEKELINGLVGKTSNTKKIKFRLAVPSTVTDAYAKVVHKSEGKVLDTKYYQVMTAENGEKYIEIETTGFSTFEVTFTNTVPNPNTSDNIIMFTLIGMMAMAGLVIAKKKFAK